MNCQPLFRVYALQEGEHHVDTQGLQIQNIFDKRVGNPDREDHWLFAFRLQPLLSEV